MCLPHHPTVALQHLVISAQDAAISRCRQACQRPSQSCPTPPSAKRTRVHAMYPAPLHLDALRVREMQVPPPPWCGPCFEGGVQGIIQGVQRVVPLLAPQVPRADPRQHRAQHGAAQAALHAGGGHSSVRSTLPRFWLVEAFCDMTWWRGAPGWPRTTTRTVTTSGGAVKPQRRCVGRTAAQQQGRVPKMAGEGISE
jgi:hypothetical protein